MDKNIDHKIETYPTMTYEGWWAYMFSHLIIYDLKDTHCIHKDKEGNSWLKRKAK